MGNLFYISNTIYNDLIRNLAYPVVWQIVRDLIIKHPIEFAAGVWFLLSCLLGSCISAKERQSLRLVHWIDKTIDPDLIPFRDSVTRTIAYDLITQFFTRTGSEADDLRKCVLRHVPELREISQRRVRHCAFALAKTLVTGLSDRTGLDALTRPLIRNAREVLQRAETPNDPDAVGCLDFLTACEVGLREDHIVSIVGKILLPDDQSDEVAVASDFAVRAAVALVERRRRSLDGTKFRSDVEEIVLKCWNSHSSRNLALAAGCLDILAAVRPGFAQTVAVARQINRVAQLLSGALEKKDGMNGFIRLAD
jgi:hypothetical protein